MGTDGRHYFIRRWELIAGDTILRAGNDGTRYDIRDNNRWQAVLYRRWEMMAGDTIYRLGN